MHDQPPNSHRLENPPSNPKVLVMDTIIAQKSTTKLEFVDSFVLAFNMKIKMGQKVSHYWNPEITDVS